MENENQELLTEPVPPEPKQTGVERTAEQPENAQSGIVEQESAEQLSEQSVMQDEETQSEEAQQPDGKPKKRKKEKKRLFVRRSTMEWVSTVCICALVMYIGYALMSAMKSTGTSGLLSATFGKLNMDLRMVFLAMAAALAATVGRRDSRWMVIPVGLGTALCCYEIWTSVRVVAVIAYGLITKQLLMEDILINISTLMPYLLEFSIVLMSILAMVFGMVALLSCCCRVASVVFWVLWILSYDSVILINTAGAILDNMNRIAVAIYAILLTVAAVLPMVRGKRVVKSEISALQVEDELAYWLEKNGKKELPSTPAEDEKDPEDELSVPPYGEQPTVEEPTQAEPTGEDTEG